ncbi:MAG: hypothetical protein IKY44_03180 [Clostridia bacterium]|nr:hypothetical protein [Clostridia bacterium]
MEILVAVSILGIIVGPLLASLFSNNRVIEYARKQTEATYVAKKVMEETLADYYASLPTSTSADAQDSKGYPTYIGHLITLLNKNETGVDYPSSVEYKSKYADDFVYDIKIVPSGKAGMGTATGDNDETANYLHIYRDKLGTAEFAYVVFPDANVTRITLDGSNNELNIAMSGQSLQLSNNSTRILNFNLDSSKKDFRINLYSSNDAFSRNLKFDASTMWWNSDCARYLTNYTSKYDSSQTNVTADTDFIPTENLEEFESSGREEWNIALYEITVTVYEEGSSKPLSSAQGVIEVKIFP